MKAAAQTVRKAAAVIRTSGLDLTDALGLAGFVLLLDGIAEFSVPAAKIAAGALILAFVILTVRRK